MSRKPNARYFEERFTDEQAEAKAESLRQHCPGLEVHVSEVTWSKDGDGHEAGDYMYSRLVFLVGGQFVAIADEEADCDRLFILARLLTNTGVYANE